MTKSGNNPLLPALRKQAAQAPTTPGIYRWLDADGTILYIGKAKNLRSRLKSYVQAKEKAASPWKRALIDRIAGLDLTVTETELEALVLETNLIKEHRPKYNVLMKDDKNYVYVRVTVDDTYPMVETVRKMPACRSGKEEGDKAKYFGPFLSAYGIRQTLDTLQSVFAYRACTPSIEKLNRTGELPDRPCLNFQIGQCNGLCAGKVSKEEYRARIEEVVRFLKGQREHAVTKLKEQMQIAAVEKKFERAGKLRDTLRYIESLEEKQTVSDTSGENTDAVGISLLGERIQVVVLEERGGKLIGEHAIALKGIAENVSDALAQFLPQYYSGVADLPDTVILGETIEEQELLQTWLSERKGRKVQIRIPERGKKSKLLMMAERNAVEKIRQQFARWEAAAKNTEDALEDLRNILDLPERPKRIEGYDISHLSGTETVGSMVVAKNGKAANAEYRSFTIRTLKEGEVDDYKALKEVLKRRLLHLERNGKEQEKMWKERGIEFGKARKAEQKLIEEICNANPEIYAEPMLNYKDSYVARRKETGAIIALCSLRSWKTTLELTGVWAQGEIRDERIGQLLMRIALHKVKKGKVYLVSEPKLHLYFEDVGFRVIHSAPEPIESITKKHPQYVPMMYEAKEQKPDASLGSRPDLLVIDGGKGQLSAAMEVTKNMKMGIPVIALAKREEEVFAPTSPVPIPFSSHSQAKFLLMRLRDEAHRFANRHREKRGKHAAISSVLDEIPGIGEKTKKELLKEFGSVAGVKSASDETLKLLLNAAQIQALRERL